MDAAGASRDAVVWLWAMDNGIANENVFIAELGRGTKRGEEVLSQPWFCYHHDIRDRPEAFESQTKQREKRWKGRACKGKKVGGSVEDVCL